jgi:ABC-type transport system substrate-binding protein
MATEDLMSGKPLRKLLALGIALLAISACGGSKQPATTPAGSAKAGDTLTIAIQAPPNSLNPATVDNAFTTYTLLAYESLVYQASDGSLQPGLAKSWQYVGAGNKQLDLTLRTGVKFSDGDPVTAEAVKASLDYSLKALGPQAPLLAGVTSIDVTGPASLSIKLSAPNPLVPQILTQYYGIGQIISPQGLRAAANLTVAHPSAGAGPYVFDPGTSVAGDHYTYNARSDYFEPSRQHYKKVVVRVIANPQAVVNALKTHQVDIVAGGDTTSASQATAAGLQIVSMPFVWQGLNLIDRGGEVSKPLGDVRVRQAINYAIDRKTVANAVLGKYGVPSVETVVEGAGGYSTKAAGSYPYDPEKAKQLLADAGYQDGFTLPVLSVKFGGIDTMAQALAGQLAKVGIKVDLTTAPDAQTYVTQSTSRKFPVVVVAYGAGPMYLVGAGLFLPTAAVFNGFKTNSSELVALYTKAAAAAPPERAAIDIQMQEYLVQNAWFAPVAFSPVLYFARPDLGGLKVNAQAPVACPLDWFDTK